jgi:ABC-type nitrate/sulfonate/bicarbonate transport system permease component
MPSQERGLAGALGYYVPSALVILGLLAAWQLAVDWGGVKEYILPSPLAALKAFLRPNYQWTANFLATFYATIGAFALSAVLGIALAVVIVWNDLLMRTVMPVLVLFNTLPKIALAPLAWPPPSRRFWSWCGRSRPRAGRCSPRSAFRTPCPTSSRASSSTPP